MSALAGGRLRLDFPADDVARLTIDSQAKRNALDRELLDAFAAALGEVECRCLLLTAAGSIFSAGYDIGELPAGGDAAAATGDPSTFEREAERSSRTRSRPRWSPWTRSASPWWPRSTATRSAAGSSSRWPATCGSRRRARSSACPRPASG